MQTNQTSITTAVHPFELAGMGTGPYRFCGMVSIPSAALAEANCEAYNGALRDLPRDLIGGCGTCANCGTAIMNICIVSDAQGRRYGVGCDCVDKTGDASIGNPVGVAIAKHRQAQAHARRDAQADARRIAFDSAIATDSRAQNGETNAELRARLNSEHAAAVASADASRAKVAAVLAPIADVIADGQNGFCDSIARDMKRGIIPAGRGLTLTIDIFAKRHGRRNSNAFESANLLACEIFDAAEKI